MLIKVWFIIVVMFCLVGSTLYDSGVTKEQFINVTNDIGYDDLNFTSQLRETGDDENKHFTTRFVYKIVDALIYIFTEGMMAGIKFGYEHPYYNFGLIAMIAIIGLYGFPLILVIVFIFYAIKSMVKFFKERKLNKQGGIK